MRKYISIFAIALAFASCSKNIETAKPVYTTTFVASSIETKTYFGEEEVTETGTKQRPTLWKEGDVVGLYTYNNQTWEYEKLTDLTAQVGNNSETATFVYKGETDLTGKIVYFLSTANGSIKRYAGDICTSIPLEQSSNGNIDPEAQLLFAETTVGNAASQNNLTFAHVSSYANVKLEGLDSSKEIESVQFTADQPLGGLINSYSGKSIESSNKDHSITVKTSNSDNIWIAVAASDAWYSINLMTVTVTFKDKTSVQKEFNINGQLKFTQGVVKPIKFNMTGATAPGEQEANLTIGSEYKEGGISLGKVIDDNFSWTNNPDKKYYLILYKEIINSAFTTSWQDASGLSKCAKYDSDYTCEEATKLMTHLSEPTAYNILGEGWFFAGEPNDNHKGMPMSDFNNPAGKYYAYTNALTLDNIENLLISTPFIYQGDKAFKYKGLVQDTLGYAYVDYSSYFIAVKLIAK